MAKLREANNVAFLTRGDLDHFVGLLKRILEEDKPAGHQCDVYVSSGADGGVYIRSGKLDDDIARLMFVEFMTILKYDGTADAYINIGGRLKWQMEGKITITLSDGSTYALESPSKLKNIDPERECIFLFDNGQIFEGSTDGLIDGDGDFCIIKPGKEHGIALPFARLEGWAYKKGGSHGDKD